MRFISVLSLITILATTVTADHGSPNNNNYNNNNTTNSPDNHGQGQGQDNGNNRSPPPPFTPNGTQSLADIDLGDFIDTHGQFVTAGPFTNGSCDMYKSGIGGVSIDSTGRNGNMTIQPIGPSGPHPNHYSLQFERMVEIGVDNSTTYDSIQDWQHSTMQWQKPQPVTLLTANGSYVNATLVQFSGNATTTPSNASVTIAMSVYMLSAEAVLPNGNHSLAVSTSQIKFDIDITGWPFSSTSNTLQFGLNVVSGNRQQRPRPMQHTQDNTTGTAVMTAGIGGVTLVNPSNVFCDGVQRNMTAALSNPVGGPDGVATVHYVFPYAANTIHYDPVISTDTTASTTSTSAATASGAGMPVLTAVLMSAVVAIMM